MKKVFTVFLAVLLCLVGVVASAAEAPTPTQKIVLFYRADDALLACQNSAEDIEKGRVEFEKLLAKYYGKRFIVQEIRQNPDEEMTLDEYKQIIKFNQKPFIVIMEAAGEGTSVDHYQNAFGAQKSGAYKTFKIHIKEFSPNKNNNGFNSYDYGVLSYGSGTFTFEGMVFAQDTNPRKIAKKAVNAVLYTVCRIDDEINKYAYPTKYQMEIERFNGVFDSFVAVNDAKNKRAEAFENWCKQKMEEETEEVMKKTYSDLLNLFQNSSLDQKMIYIDSYVKSGLYSENIETE